jgi:hypothetical protein
VFLVALGEANEIEADVARACLWAIDSGSRSFFEFVRVLAYLEVKCLVRIQIVPAAALLTSPFESRGVDSQSA